MIIVTADNPAGIREFRALAEADAQILLAENGLPITEYTKDVLTNADFAYRGNFYQRVIDKVSAS